MKKLLVLSALLVILILSIQSTDAFIGPSTGQTPGSGGGLFNVDENRNIGFGTASSTPVSTFDNVGGGGGENHGYVFLVASTSNPGLGLRNTSLNHMYLWSVRNIGSQSRIDLYRESPVLPGKVLLSINEGGFVGISAAPTSTYRLIVEGNIYASGTLSSANPISGSLSAANVTGPSAFGVNYGTYNFAFPNAIAVGTTTTAGLPANSLTVTGTTTLATVAGRVGIGTTNPGATLDVRSGAAKLTFNGAQLTVVSGSNDYRGYIFVRDGDGGQGLGAGSVEIGSTGTNSISFQTQNGAINALVIKGSNGYVGVGTSTPQYLLHAYGSGNQYLALEAGSASSFVSKGSSGTWYFGSSVNGTSGFNLSNSGAANASNIFVSNSTGYVGIATTTPSDELTVFGDIRISKSGSALIFPDGTSQTTAGTGVTAWTKNGANVYLTTLTDSVGIGTTTPGAKLQIVQPTVNVAALKLGQDTAAANNFGDWTGIDFLLSNQVSQLTGNPAARIASYLQSTNNTFGLQFWTRSDAATFTEKVRIDAEGDVGIATTTPAEKLSVVGGGIFYGATGNISAGVYYDRSNSSYYLDPGANENAYSLITAGNVGIGTTTPATALNVSGASNQLRLNANATEYGNFSVAASTGVLTISTNVGSDPDVQLTPGTNGELNLGSAISVSGSTLNMGGGIISGLNEAYGDDGGATDPSFTFSNNQQTGLFQSAGNLGLTASGTEVMRLTAGGNVGIGTSTPVQKLTVIGDLSVSAGGSTFGSPIYVGGGSGVVYATQLGGTTGVNANIIANNSVKMTILSSNGNVGIATTTPAYPLTVNGTIASLTGGFRFPDGTTQTTSAVGGGGYWSLSGVNLYPTSTSYKAVIGGTVATSSLTVIGDATLYGASGNISVGVYYDRTNTAYYLDPGANENAYSLTVAGSVGIGTTAPKTLLNVKPASAGAYPTLGTNSGQLFIGGDTNLYGFYAGTVSDGNAWMQVMRNDAATAYNLILQPVGGNVGIATTTPGYKLTVAGTSYFGNQITLAAGVQIAATNNTNSISLAGGDITGVDKLTVTTIDPLYSIKGKKYSTYAASIAGGVKEEYVGSGKLITYNKKLKTYEYTVDFDEVGEGSDLWVWRHAVDFSDENVQVLVTSKKVPVPIAYEISGDKITFRANAAVEFSYRLIGNRFDWEKWPTFAKDQNEWTSLIVK